MDADNLVGGAMSHFVSGELDIVVNCVRRFAGHPQLNPPPICARIRVGATIYRSSLANVRYCSYVLACRAPRVPLAAKRRGWSERCR